MRGVLALAAVVLGAAYAADPCSACHPKQSAAFAASAMGQSISRSLVLPGGRIEHRRSGSTLEIRSRSGGMEHRLTRGRLHARYDVDYTVGAGKVGYSFLVRIGNSLFQSPASFYSSGNQWDLTPGYESESLLDFDHPILSGCLFCHAGAPSEPLTPITCERCHGPSKAHLERPTSGTIVNPAKLPLRERDSVCEQCHLEGATRILNAGRGWWDFRPGQELESAFAVYVRRRVRTDIPAVSHSEQLAESACARDGRLWCGTCHNPHGESNVRAVCAGCHPGIAGTAQHPPSGDCTACHMPKLQATNVAHAAVTDHRIPRLPGRTRGARSDREGPLAAWREPHLEQARRRGLGLAYFEMGASHRSKSDLEQAYDLLKPLARSTLDDPDVQVALGGMLLQMGHPEAAIPYLEEALRRSASDARLHQLLGEALAASGAKDRAAAELESAIRLDPAGLAPYEQLAKLRGLAVLRRYLDVMPQSIRVRDRLPHFE